MKFWGNLLGYQAVWFAAIIGAEHGQVWPGLIAAPLFIAWQVAWSDRRDVEWRLLAAGLVCGVLLDGVLSFSGLARYATPTPALPPGGAPLWIVLVWLSFSLTLSQSLRYLQTRPWLALAFGALGGPIAYAGASRAFDVVRFQPPLWHALAVLAIGWAIAMPTLSTLARRWTERPSPRAIGTLA